MRLVRWPLALLAVGLVMLVVAVWLDRGGEGSRDLALLVGATALNLVLPAALLWLLVLLIIWIVARVRRER